MIGFLVVLTLVVALPPLCRGLNGNFVLRDSVKEEKYTRLLIPAFMVPFVMGKPGTDHYKTCKYRHQGRFSRPLQQRTAMAARRGLAQWVLVLRTGLAFNP